MIKNVVFDESFKNSLKIIIKVKLKKKLKTNNLAKLKHIKLANLYTIGS